MADEPVQPVAPERDVLWRGQPISKMEAPELREAVRTLIRRNHELTLDAPTPRERVDRLRAGRSDNWRNPNPNRWTSTDTLIFGCGLFSGIVLGLAVIPSVFS